MTSTMAEWRKVEETVSDGPGNERTETSYQFGAEIEGVYVPAFTKSAGYIEHLIEREQARTDREQAAAGGKSGSKASASGSQTKNES